VTLSLTADGALGITVEAGAAGFAARWLPQGLPELTESPRASIAVKLGAFAERPATMPTLTVGPVAGWMSERYLILRGTAASGDVDLTSGRAVLRVDPGSGDTGEGDVYGMLTIAAGVLLAGLGRALIHGAAIVPPGDAAWVLIGDSGSGKSTTCATLCRAGWSYLSDDQVILSNADRGVTVEGWVRPFHLDRDWERGERSGTRAARDAATLFPDQRRVTAPLAGLLLPKVAATHATALTAADPAEALAELIRQSPWVLLDRGAAPVVLDLLAAAASRCRPPHRLTLGADSYGSPERMSSVFASVVGAG
jgi:predicted ATPase